MFIGGEVKVGDMLYNESEPYDFAKVKCGAEEFTLKGTLIGEVTGDINTADKDATITFAVVGGKQTPSEEYEPISKIEYGPYNLHTYDEVTKSKPKRRWQASMHRRAQWYMSKPERQAVAE